MAQLELKDLRVALEDGTEIVKGVSLRVATNEVHAILGPNGSGKSTLAYAIAGHPAYEITGGQILLDGEDITEAAADERAQAGLFLAFQYPHAIPGVTVTNFLRTAINAVRKARAGGVDDPIPVKEFRTVLFAEMDRLKVSRELASRYLNDGFSNPDEAKNYFFKSGRGLSHELVEAIAEHKNEPAWMRKFRHDSLDNFLRRPMPAWGGDLSGIDFDNIYYYIKPTEKQAASWE